MTTHKGDHAHHRITGMAKRVRTKRAGHRAHAEAIAAARAAGAPMPEVKPDGASPVRGR